MSEARNIRIEKPSDGVALVALGRPERLNALHRELFDALSETFERLSDGRSFHDIVLRAGAAGGDAGRAGSWGCWRYDPARRRQRDGIGLGERSNNKNYSTVHTRNARARRPSLRRGTSIKPISKKGAAGIRYPGARPRQRLKPAANVVTCREIRRLRSSRQLRNFAWRQLIMRYTIVRMREHIGSESIEHVPHSAARGSSR